MYPFIGFAGISYGRFVAVRYKFNLSVYVKEPLVIVRWGCVQRELNEETAAGNVHNQSSVRAV